jgi:hypothetical protein
MNLTELRSYLTGSADVQALLQAVAKEYHNRNLDPHSGVTSYDGNVTEPDPLMGDYTKLLEVIHGKMLQTDLTSLTNAEDEEFYYNTIWFGENEDGSTNTRRAASMVICYLLGMYLPNIDEYITRIEDYSLPKSLGIPVDNDGLVILDKDMELRSHALILPSQQTMIYPHQFLRRFYHANFVNMPILLEKHRKEGKTVKIRIDPLRVTHPNHYRGIIEEDYWHGPKFSASLLQSKDKKPIRTLHGTIVGGHNFIYPVDFTLFRSEMMSGTERQFMVEEYVPLTNPVQPERRIHGIGKEHCIQKFAHFVYDQEQQIISHIDGAVRTFAIKDYGEILDSFTRGSEPDKRVGTRHKLFKVEGSISIEQVESLLYEFFMYNRHIGEYFSNALSSQELPVASS